MRIDERRCLLLASCVCITLAWIAAAAGAEVSRGAPVVTRQAASLSERSLQRVFLYADQDPASTRLDLVDSSVRQFAEIFGLGDADGDEVDELLSLASFPGFQVFVAHDIEAGLVDFFFSVTLDSASQVAAANLDGDDDREVLIASGSQIHVVQSDGSVREVISTGFSGSFSLTDLSAGDFDGDGADEILVVGEPPLGLGSTRLSQLDAMGATICSIERDEIQAVAAGDVILFEDGSEIVLLSGQAVEILNESCHVLRSWPVDMPPGGSIQDLGVGNVDGVDSAEVVIVRRSEEFGHERDELVVLDASGTELSSRYLLEGGTMGKEELVGVGRHLRNSCPTQIYRGNDPSFHADWVNALQGVAHDDEHWFFTQTNAIYKVPLSDDLSGDAPGTAALLPSELASASYDHFGDLDQSRGYLLVPVTGHGVPPIIAVFRADDLTFVGSAPFPEAPDGSRQRGAGWVAVHPQTGIVYSSDNHIRPDDPSTSNREDALFLYDIDWDAIGADVPSAISYRDRLPVQEADGQPLRGVVTDRDPDPGINYMQGGVFSPWGDLYLVNGLAAVDADESRGGIHILDSSGRLIGESKNGFGAFNYEYEGGFEGVRPLFQEPEGIDWLNLDGVSSAYGSGQLHVIVVDHEDLFLAFCQAIPNCHDQGSFTHTGDHLFFKHYEVDYWCKAGLDSDGDRLDDDDEVYVYYTDPLNPDTDGDGLGDGDEVEILGTDPRLADSDGDGVGDGDEDTDGDGLRDAEELGIHGTDPLSADSDADFLPDGVELLGFNPTDPLNPDTDGDGLVDGVEDGNRNGNWDPGETDPNDPDSDDDELGDGVELLGFNPTDPLNPDTDGDGLVDGVEDGNRNGNWDPGETDPNDPDSDDDELGDGDEVRLGMNPLDPDTDRDGVRDGEDPDFVAVALASMPPGIFRSASDPAGQRSAMFDRLSEIEQKILAGDRSAAIRALQNLRRGMDGCDGSLAEAPDSNDWIVECAAQRSVRQLIDLLITNLGV